jgi:hypothetical protein
VPGGNDENEICAFCKRGLLIERDREIAFRQQTRKGYVFCRVVVPIGICETCGCESFTGTAERIVEEAVRHEYEKLP